MRLARMSVAATFAAAAAGGAIAGPLAEKDCQQILPSQGLAPQARRLEAEDLVRMRDIGPVDPHPWAAPFFTISPDGSKAFARLSLRPTDIALQ